MRHWFAALVLVAAPLPAPAAAPSPARAEGAKLAKVFHESDERELRLDPMGALLRGDLRYADRLADYFTDAQERAETAAIEADLAALAAIDRSRLDATDQLAYDVFRGDRMRELRARAPAMLAISRVLPIDHMDGLQAWYPNVASGEAGAPFKTVLDYENNLKRNAQYAAALDRAIPRLREGIAAGITLPKVAAEHVVEQLDGLIADGAESSPFTQPVRNFPAAVPAAARTRLAAAYADQLASVLTPAHKRLRAFLAEEYLPKARTSVGLGDLPGGAAFYRTAIEGVTTLAADPEELHRLGLAELEKDKAELAAIREKVGFAGDNAAFFEYLRTDKRFEPASADAVRAAYADIARRVDLRVREQFSLLPKTGIVIKPVPAFSEKSAAPGFYSGGSADGSRPGTFYFNTYNLPARRTWMQEDLYLHEAVPGHHFQISLAHENARLPAFMRFGGNTAYVEGWGLYAESLGPALGMMTDPWQRVGGLYGDMVRAVRLVVDTGIHAKGWTREQAIAFELANVPITRTVAVAEVDRYMVSPAQALAYKLGQLTITRLKAKAKAALGARFDPRRFHAVVLGSGALPLPILEARVEAWIAAGGA